jgi:lipid-A-disaccharide synthase-like uncharacterized protein
MGEESWSLKYFVAGGLVTLYSLIQYAEAKKRDVSVFDSNFW